MGHPQPEGGDSIKRILILTVVALAVAALTAGASWGGNSWSKTNASWSS